MFKSGELAGCRAKPMSQPSAEYSARRSAILLFKFPGFGWGGALSSWILSSFVDFRSLDFFACWIVVDLGIPILNERVLIFFQKWNRTAFTRK